MKNKLISEKHVLIHKQDISKTFECTAFEPKLCCFCEQVDKFVDKLTKTNHNPLICLSE